MKRDMDLIRKILFQIEANNSLEWDLVHVDGYDLDIVNYHVFLLADAGLIRTNELKDTHSYHILVSGLTWKGHEFLDSAKDDNRWKKAKSIVLEKIGNLSFSTLQYVLNRLTMDTFTGDFPLGS